MQDVPVRTPEALVTLASIVEKETGRPDERSRVAAVFVNRLRQRMKLQSDPTIIYGLVGGKGTLGRPIMRSEIEQPTPYNTYVIEGLPPGPIANPGRASLEATANPARTKELFFVADGTGGHAFAENLQQHQQNVAKLRQFEQQIAQLARRRLGCRIARSQFSEPAPRRRRDPAPQVAPGQEDEAEAAKAKDAVAPHAAARPCDRQTLAAKVRRDSRPQRDSVLMALSSMTGFARADGVSGHYVWAWELKSVNAKGLELRAARCRPAGTRSRRRCARAPPRRSRAAPCTPI